MTGAVALLGAGAGYYNVVKYNEWTEVAEDEVKDEV